jgi:hypothetical protein
VAVAVDDGSTSAARAGTAGLKAGLRACAATVAAAPVAATPDAAAICAVASAALAAAACAGFTIPTAGIGAVRMGGGNPGKTRGKTAAAVEAWQVSRQYRKAAYRQGGQSQQAYPHVFSS